MQNTDSNVAGREPRGDRLETWCALVLFATITYALVGIPDLDRHALRATDYVDPLNRWIWLGLLALAAPALRFRPRAVASVLVASWPILALYAWFALSTTWALDPAASTRRALQSCVQFSLMVLLVCGLRRDATMHACVAASCLVVVIAELAVAVAAPGFAFEPDGFAGLHLQKNTAGVVMLYCVLACGSGVLLMRHRAARAAFAAAAAGAAGLLLLTRSSTSIGVAFSTPIATLIVYRVACLRRPAILAIAWGVALALAAAAFGYVAWRAANGADPWLPLRGVTFTERKDLWLFTAGEIAKRPWTGYGYGSFWAIDPAVQPSLKLGSWFGTGGTIINSGHNGYLDLAATTGCIGLAMGALVALRTLALAGLAIGSAGSRSEAWRDGTMGRGTAAFHLAFMLAFVTHNAMESDLFAINPQLGAGFLLCALDLRRWRRERRQAAPHGATGTAHIAAGDGPPTTPRDMLAAGAI